MRWMAAILVGALAACDGSAVDPGPVPQTMEFDFSTTTHGWTAGFADYPVGEAESMELTSGHEPLPTGLDATGRGLFIAGTNHSDDLFMFWKGRVESLEPNSRYRVDFEVAFATEAPSGCAGIGGPPGESVYVKVGATPVEPEPVVEQEAEREYYRMNIDKANQSASGDDAIVIGHVGNSRSECADTAWEIKTLQSDEAFEVTTANDGSVWLLFGTDSGFEGRTRIYFTRFEATFSPV